MAGRFLAVLLVSDVVAEEEAGVWRSLKYLSSSSGWSSRKEGAVSSLRAGRSESVTGVDLITIRQSLIPSLLRPLSSQ